MLSTRDPTSMESAGCKASSPLIFLFPQQQVLFLLSLLCLALILPFITSSATTSTSNITSRDCIKEERDALLTFKAQMTYHKIHPISSWGDQIDECCHWDGVRCDNNSGHVVRLDLKGALDWGLRGNISQSLLVLQHLTYLDLSDNFFVNFSIPKLLGLLENLVYLDLRYSGFTGVIPHELGNLTRLRYLNLDAEEGRGYSKVDDAEWLSGLSSLEYLFMDHVNFSGVDNIMQSLNKLYLNAA